MTLVDADPTVPGLDLAAGATFRLRLPAAFENTGTRVASASEPGCGPPLVVDCTTAVLVQGWPQSPVLPFPNVTLDAATNTFEVTTSAAWAPDPPESPGAKTLHLQAFGFRNPDRPGVYPVDLEIRPDPSSDRVMLARTSVRITPRSAPHLGVLSTVNGSPPPPFPNSVYQRTTLENGPTDLLTWGLYLWARDAQPLTGARIVMLNRYVGLIVDSTDQSVGRVRIRPPRGARAHRLDASPSVPALALLSGQPTGLMRADFTPDPVAKGLYRITFTLFGGSSQDFFVTVD